MILVLCISLLSLIQSSAQDLAPLIASNTVELDRILIYDMASDTIHALNFGDYRHHVWDFSPDGCRLLFTMSDGTLPAKLYSVRIDGQDLRELVTYTDLPSSEWGVWEPDWSPDGATIAFTMIRNISAGESTFGQSHHIARIPATGGIPEFYSITGREYSPQWSPDGAWLAYTSRDDTPALAADLWVVSTDGETKYQLTYFPTGSVNNPRWSPNNQSISFTHAQNSGNHMVWMVNNQHGATPIQLTYTASLILDITWLPDSSHIITAMRDFKGLSENRLWQVPLSGMTETNTTLYLDTLNLSHADYPRFSPDGNWLVTRSAYELALVNLRDSSLTWLSQKMLGNTPIVWSSTNVRDAASCP
jgi:Tol biopolymer transport system component